MDVLRNFGRKLFGINKEKKVEVQKEKKVEAVKEEAGSRKRQLDEEVITKDSLNHPAKRPRMADGETSSPEEADTATSPVHTIISKLKSWIHGKSSPELVECSPAIPTSVADAIQAAPPTLYSSARLETDEVELLKVVNPKVDQSPFVSSSEAAPLIPRDKLATFSGFTSSPVSTSSLTPSQPGKGGHTGHSIRTGHEKERKAELLSPQNIRKRLQSGLRSTYDKFYHEKDIAKRIRPGGIVKKKPKQNAFEFSAALADRNRYKALLERHSGSTIVKYSAWTNKTNIVFDSPSR